jgi:hypothetical protein
VVKNLEIKGKPKIQTLAGMALKTAWCSLTLVE